MVKLQEIEIARSKLPAEIVPTPVHRSDDLNRALGRNVYLKCENLQVTGSYKARAAFNILDNLTPGQRSKGAAISSSGNFASAFAFMGRLLDIPVAIVMMKRTAPFKIEKTKSYGARVVLCENRFGARWETLDRLEREEGIVAVNTFESADVITGHGTIGLEIAEFPQEIESVLVPISSGGLLAGIAVAVKERLPRVKVIGVQPQGSQAAYLSFKSGMVQSIARVDTICDALVATKPGQLPFEHIMHYVDDVVVVPEEAVKAAVRLVFEAAKLVIEPSAGVGIAALLTGLQAGGKDCLALLSGGNVSREMFSKILRES